MMSEISTRYEDTTHVECNNCGWKGLIMEDMKKKQIIKEKKKRVIINNWDLTDYEQWYDKKYCMKAVKQDGDLLQYVREQTPEICLAAVKQDGYSLRFVRDQTEAICLAAVKQNGYSLQFVRELNQNFINFCDNHGWKIWSIGLGTLAIIIILHAKGVI